MALIKCKECEKEISSDAVNCPSCGAPVKPIKKKGGFLNFLKKMVITWLVIAAVFYAGFLYVKGAVQEKVVADKAEKAAKLKRIDDTMAKHKKEMAEDRAKREAEAKALAEERRAFSEAIAPKIEQNKFYAILLDHTIPNIKQWAASELNDCKKTIEKLYRRHIAGYRGIPHEVVGLFLHSARMREVLSQSFCNPEGRKRC